MHDGKGTGRPLASDTVLDNTIQILQFTGGMDLRVAGQNLLDERAAGTGHADDEDWHRRGIAHPAEAIEQAGVEPLGDGRKSSLMGRFIVMDFAALQSIALEQMLEGARIVADVFERLAEREVDVQHLAGRQTVGVGGKRFERGEIGIARAKGFEIRAMVMRFGVIRPEGQRLLVTCRGLVELALRFSTVPRLLCAGSRA